MKFPSDRELFPALFDPSKQKGTLKADYAAELERCWEAYIDRAHRGGAASFPSYSEFRRYEDELRVQREQLWDHMDCWLAERLKHGTVDSFPDHEVTLCRTVCTIHETEINESGKAKQAANAQHRANLDAEMAAYRKNMDDRERLRNVLLDGSPLTDEELAAQGRLSSEDYGTSTMCRDLKELEKRQALEREWDPETLDSDDYDTTVRTETLRGSVRSLHMVDQVAVAVEDKYRVSGRYLHGMTLFKLLEPLYVVSHTKEIKKQERDGLWILLAPLLAVALRWVSKTVITEGALHWLLSLASTALFFCTFCGVGLLLLLIFSDGLVEGLRSLFLPSKTESTDLTNAKKRAQENIQEVYRRLRFYTLWAKQAGKEEEVKRMQNMFDEYLATL